MKEKKFRIFGPDGFTYFDLSNVPNYINKDNVEDYIGFKDKNGVEIYESDIYKTSMYGPCLVEWGKSNCSCQGRIVGWNVDIEDIEYIEVIGNKHKNPELLE